MERLKLFVPSRKIENFEWQHQTFLEWLFFWIIDIFYRIPFWIDNIPSIDQDHSQGSFLKKTSNFIIIFLVSVMISFTILIIPLSILPQDPSENSVLLQLILILFFGSLTWTSFVYLSINFKDFLRTKIVSSPQQCRCPFRKSLLIQIVNGFCFEWPSGKTIRIYFRDFIGLCATTFLIGLYLIIRYQVTLTQPSLGSINVIGVFLNIIFPIFLVSFIFFSIVVSGLTILQIFYILTGTVLFLPKQYINPYLEMGGTQKFGDIIVHALYQLAIALGLLPIILFIVKSDFSKIFLLPNTLSTLENQSLDNITISLKSAILQSFGQIHISDFSRYDAFIEVFFIFVAISVVLLLILHFLIKARKDQELQQLDDVLGYDDFYNQENPANRTRIQYYLTLYQQLLTLHEWPVKKMFILDLIISVLLLFISHIFS